MLFEEENQLLINTEGFDQLMNDCLLDFNYESTAQIVEETDESPL